MLPTHTEIASLGVMRKSQCPLILAVDTPVRRSALLMVRAKDAEVCGAARKATSTVVPRPERKHACRAQHLEAQHCKIGTSWSRSSSRARKAFDVATNADIRLTPGMNSSTARRCVSTVEHADASSRYVNIGVSTRRSRQSSRTIMISNSVRPAGVRCSCH